MDIQLIELQKQNKELKQKLYRKNYYAKNKDKLLQYSKDYYKKNKCHDKKPKPKWKGEKIKTLEFKEGHFTISFE